MKYLKYIKINILDSQNSYCRGTDSCHTSNSMVQNFLIIPYAHDYSVLSMIFINHNNCLFLPYYSVTHNPHFPDLLQNIQV